MPPSSKNVRSSVTASPRVIELAVVVEHAAAQALDFKGGRVRERRFLAEQLAAAEAEFAGEEIVHRQPHAIPGFGPPGIGRDDEAHVVDQMGRVADQQAALAQGLANEVNVALGKITHAAVHELGGA